MDLLNKISRFLNRTLVWMAGIFLVAMVLLTCSNIFLRLVWEPVRGTFELMGFFGAIVVAFSLGYTQIKRGHVAVNILVIQFSKKTRMILDSINYSICMIFFAATAWQIAKWGTTLRQTGEVTETLRIIFYPFTYGVAFGCIVLALVLLIDLLKLFVEEKGAG
jgi:TRAP-type C4-dicarboxylate transport system permease small subunit